MENNYWHKMVVLTGLTLLLSTLALTLLKKYTLVLASTNTILPFY